MRNRRRILLVQASTQFHELLFRPAAARKLDTHDLSEHILDPGMDRESRGVVRGQHISGAVDPHELLVRQLQSPARAAVVREFFRVLSDATDGKALYAADAGLHQVLTRRYAVATLPRGLLCPSDFQSMGFGLPGAIGAAFARPEARVVACVGDGGLTLSAGELLTAVREGIDLVIAVFNDGQLNLIRRQQVTRFGYESGVRLRNPDYRALAEAVGCSYFAVAGDIESVVHQVIATRGVRLVELRLADTPSFYLQQIRSAARERVRPLVPAGVWQALKALIPR